MRFRTQCKRAYMKWTKDLASYMQINLLPNMEPSLLMVLSIQEQFNWRKDIPTTIVKD